MKKELELQILSDNVAKLHADPDEESQVESYIRKKYKIFGDDPSDMYDADFANKFLSFDQRTKEILFPDGHPSLCRFFDVVPIHAELTEVIPGIGINALPAKVMEFLKSVLTANFFSLKKSPTTMSPEEKKAANDLWHKGELRLGLIVFAKMFSSTDSVNKWKTLFEKAPPKTLLLLDALLFLPTKLRNLYVDLRTNPYQQARDVHAALEQLLYLHGFKGLGQPMLYSYYDYLKDIRGERYDIPANKLDDRLDQTTFDYIEDYYTQLTELLPTLCKEHEISTEAQQLNQRIQNHNSTPAHFWARYICDTFIAVMGKPYYSCVATFITDIFDTPFTDNQINDLMRKEKKTGN